MGEVLLVNFPNEILAQHLALQKNSFQQTVFTHISLSSQNFENPILTVGYSFLNSRNNSLIFNRSKHF